MNPKQSCDGITIASGLQRFSMTWIRGYPTVHDAFKPPYARGEHMRGETVVLRQNGWNLSFFFGQTFNDQLEAIDRLLKHLYSEAAPWKHINSIKHGTNSKLINVFVNW